MRHGLAFATLLVLSTSAAACGDNTGSGGLAFAFALPADPAEPVAISGIPFPNDLLLDASGQLQITTASLPFAPTADPQILDNVAGAFHALNCYGATAGVIFPIANFDENDPADAATLTTDTVGLVDLATGEAVPFETHVRKYEGQVYVRPIRGRILKNGTTYAAFLRRGVKTMAGTELPAASDLAPVLSGAADPRLARASAAYAPLRVYLTAQGIAASDLVAATVFTTCDPEKDLEAIATELDTLAGPVLTVDQIWHEGAELDGLLGTPVDPSFPGSDNMGGYAHTNIGYAIAGTYPSPNYASATPNELGTFVEAGGKPMIKGYDDVPVLLVLPKLADYSDVPVVVFQHGLGGSRFNVFDVANTLCGRGFAVMGIDIPFHGGRFPKAKDHIHNFDPKQDLGPDGFADNQGLSHAADFFDLQAVGDVKALDPLVISDSFRQAAVDIMNEAHVVTDGDLSAIGVAEPALASLALHKERLVYSGESFGSINGFNAVAYEPRYGAAFFSVGGGSLISDFLENSPEYGSVFNPIIAGRFDLAPNQVDPRYDAAHTHYAYQIFSMLVDRGDPILSAHRMLERGVHVIMANALDDEALPNQSSEAMASAIGLPWAPFKGTTAGPHWIDPALLPSATLPLHGNLTTGSGMVTGGCFEMATASHGMLTNGKGKRNYDPDFPPFVPLAKPVEFSNPIVQLQGYLADFAASYLASGIPTISDP